MVEQEELILLTKNEQSSRGFLGRKQSSPDRSRSGQHLRFHGWIPPMSGFPHRHTGRTSNTGQARSHNDRHQSGLEQLHRCRSFSICRDSSLRVYRCLRQRGWKGMGPGSQSERWRQKVYPNDRLWRRGSTKNQALDAPSSRTNGRKAGRA
jgi:hypothetical protein